MTTFTNEELLDAIREAYSLEELQRMVGPSEEESKDVPDFVFIREEH